MSPPVRRGRWPRGPVSSLACLCSLPCLTGASSSTDCRRTSGLICLSRHGPLQAQRPRRGSTRRGRRRALARSWPAFPRRTGGSLGATRAAGEKTGAPSGAGRISMALVPVSVGMRCAGHSAWRQDEPDATIEGRRGPDQAGRWWGAHHHTTAFCAAAWSRLGWGVPHSPHVHDLIALCAQPDGPVRA